MVKITIITAVRNAETTISHLMDSIAAQDFDNLEHIIVDGLSKDKTLEIIGKKQQPYTKVISEKDDGIYDALNKGILSATGDVIGFLHADDFYADNHVLSKIAETFEDMDVDACYGDHEYVSSNNKNKVVRYWQAGMYQPGRFLKGWMPPHPSFFARKQMYERFGLFDTSFKISADYELMVRFIHKHQISLAYIPEVIVKMRTGGISNRNIKNICIKTLEDVKAWRINRLNGGKRAVILKNVSKIPQFFVRQNDTISINSQRYSTLEQKQSPPCVLTIDVEEWFHILESDALPDIEQWSSLESRIEYNLERLLELLESYSVKATFFWLGWLAERHKDLVLKCKERGHEIASHGYAHVLAYEVGSQKFQQDIIKSKTILENITGDPVRGFRAPGFGITTKAPWAFNIIRESGYEYDASIFPASRAHGGISNSPLTPYFIETQNGHLLEIPMSMIEIFGHRASLFGGGYLRLANKYMINWGTRKLRAAKQPLIFYVHPREIDPDQPRLKLNLERSFKYYVNLSTTLPKLKWICGKFSFQTMLEMVENYIKSFYYEGKTIPVVEIPSKYINSPATPIPCGRLCSYDCKSFRDRILVVEKAMSHFLKPDIINQQHNMNYSIKNIAASTKYNIRQLKG